MVAVWSSWRGKVDGWAKSHRKLPSAWKLFRGAARDYRAHWRPLVAITLIVTVPVALLSNYGINPSSDTTLSAYLAFAQIAMNTALIYAIVQLLQGRKVTVKQAYYTGSGALVRLLLVAILLVLMALLIVLGVIILGYGVVVPGVALSGGEQFLLAVLAIIIAIPSVILLTRGFWALYVIFETDKGPLQAIRQSRKLTKGKVVITLGRLIALVLLLLLVMIVPIVLLQFLQNLTHWSIFLVILQVIASLVVLPLSNLYLYRYYQALK